MTYFKTIYSYYFKHGFVRRVGAGLTSGRLSIYLSIYQSIYLISIYTFIFSFKCVPSLAAARVRLLARRSWYHHGACSINAKLSMPSHQGPAQPLLCVM